MRFTNIRLRWACVGHVSGMCCRMTTRKSFRKLFETKFKHEIISIPKPVMDDGFHQANKRNPSKCLSFIQRSGVIRQGPFTGCHMLAENLSKFHKRAIPSLPVNSGMFKRNNHRREWSNQFAIIMFNMLGCDQISA